MRTLNKTIKVLLVTLFAYIFYVALSIVTYSTQSDAVTADVAIVLGAAINEDKPSPVFRERINHGVSLYKQGRVKRLLFTGGIGVGEVLSEATVARDYAITQGVLPKDILIEEISTITFENLVEAQKLLHSNNNETVLLVSDPLHMKRAMMIAQDLGIDVHTAPTPTSMYRSWRTKFEFLAREVYFYIAYRLYR